VSEQQPEPVRDYRHLPARVRPEELVETQPVAGVNESGPNVDPDEEFNKPYTG
jgi:hypothetical protein